MRRFIISGVALAAALFVARSAKADPTCTGLNDNTIATVYIQSGDTQEPLMKQLGSLLIKSSSPLRILYQNQPTCTLAGNMYATPQIAMANSGTRPIHYIPTQLDVPGWDPSQAAPTCTIDPAENGGAGTEPVQLAIGATYLSSCASLPTKPATVSVTNGPTEAYGFIVPPASSQVALTAEEGYFVFGFHDAAGMANPWNTDLLKFIRGATASTALTLSASIDLPVSKLVGTTPGANLSSDVVTAVVGSTNAEATIGLLGMDVYDQVRNQVKILAFKTFGQRYAYFPDKTSTSFDKQNVRDGHYVPWSQTNYILDVDGGGAPTDANAARVRDLALNTRVGDDVNGIDAVALSALVPQCAMKVSRNFDGDELALYADPAPCGCYYETKVPSGTTACTPCTAANGQSDAACGAGKCRLGYCEAR